MQPSQTPTPAVIELFPVGPRSPLVEEVAALLKLLADPTRLAIMRLLAHREHCVCDLEQALGISQSMTSHHIGVLRRAGLVLQRRERRDARWVYYRLNTDAVDRLKERVCGFLDPSGFDPTPAHCE